VQAVAHISDKVSLKFLDSLPIARPERFCLDQSLNICSVLKIKPIEVIRIDSRSFFLFGSTFSGEPGFPGLQNVQDGKVLCYV
jgi:hypothetical protein